MTALISILVAIAAAWTLAYVGASLAAWSAAVVVYFGLLAAVGAIGWVGVIIAALVFAPVLVIFNSTSLRKKLVTAPVFKGFKAVLPPMSDTEREALEAGSTWWEAEMFRGKPDGSTCSISSAPSSPPRSSRFWITKRKRSARCSTSGKS